MAIKFLVDEDGEPILYKDGTPMPDIQFGPNKQNILQTFRVKFKVTQGPNAGLTGQLMFPDVDNANAYVEQQNKLFPDSGTQFTVSLMFNQSGISQ